MHCMSSVHEDESQHAAHFGMQVAGDEDSEIEVEDQDLGYDSSVSYTGSQVVRDDDSDSETDCNRDHALGDRIIDWVRTDNVEAIAQILREKPDLNLSRFPGKPDASSPLYGCVIFDSRNVFEFLLTCDIDLEKTVHLYTTLLMFTLERFDKYHFFARKLFEAGARVHHHHLMNLSLIHISEPTRPY